MIEIETILRKKKIQYSTDRNLRLYWLKFTIVLAEIYDCTG